MALLLAILLVFLSFFGKINGATFSTVPDFQASDADIEKLMSLMYEDDKEKPSYCDVHLNYQSSKLFAKVSEDVLKRPTFAKLLATRKFFNPQTGVAESSSPAKIQALNGFYEAVWASAPFKRLIGFLRAKKHPWTVSEAMLKSAIKQIWFDNFSRAKGKLDSSAFEHVFLGEEKNNQVSGMHSWPVMYELQQTPAEKFEYVKCNRKMYDVIGEVNLLWRGVEKPTGSFFANTSPAFDFAALTACFLSHRGKGVKCRFMIEGCNIQIQSYDMVQNGKVFIGTSYPEIGRNSASCDNMYKKREMCCMK